MIELINSKDKGTNTFILGHGLVATCFLFIDSSPIKDSRAIQCRGLLIEIVRKGELRAYYEDE